MSILFYIICFLSQVQSAQLAHLVKAFIGKHWDLGSNPRSPHIISIILFNPFPCSASFSDPSYTQRLCLPCVSNGQSSGYYQPSTIRISQSFSTWFKKSAKGLLLLGQNSSSHLLNWGQHPPWFAYSFLSFHFLFVLFILINSSKTIFIKTKKSENHKIKICFI